MTSIIKHHFFRDLLDGQVFEHKSIRWIKVAESSDYNAVRYNDSSKACDFGDTCIVRIEVDLYPEESDLIDGEAVLRETEGYKDNF